MSSPQPICAISAVVAIFAGCAASKPIPPEAKDGSLRVLVTPGRTEYEARAGVERGRTVETGKAFEAFLANGIKIVFVATPQDALVRDLIAGKGEIAANVLQTFERDDQVAFATPIRKGIRELIVTGPGSAPLVSLEDVGGRTIHVRRSSDHHASLVRLNDQLV